MTRQEQYAIDQYYLCCNHLNINPKYGDDGRTLFEEVVLMDQDIKRFSEPQTNREAALEFENKQLYNFLHRVIMHVERQDWREAFQEQLAKF